MSRPADGGRVKFEEVDLVVKGETDEGLQPLEADLTERVPTAIFAELEPFA